MANVSEAYGTITIPDNLYHNNKQVFDDFFTEAKESDNLIDCYGISIKTVKGPEITFTGLGRWQLVNNINQLLTPIDGDDYTFKKLLAVLRHPNAKPLIIEYIEYECGSEFIQNVRITLKAKAAKDVTDEDKEYGSYFEVVTEDCESLDFNDYNKIDNNFEEGLLFDNPKTFDKNVAQLTSDIKEWYDQPDNELKYEHSLEDIKSAIVKMIQTDPDYKNGICTWRYEDFDELTSLAKDALNIQKSAD